jgi:hypothetical protein
VLREYPRAPFLAAVRAAAPYGLFDLDRLERMVLRGVARDFFPPGGGPNQDGATMHDEIAQLLRSLHLSRIAEILDEQLAQAEKKQASYQDLLAVLLRAQWHHRQESARPLEVVSGRSQASPRGV